MIIEIITSELDFHLIEKVRELRIKSNLSQVTLSQKIGVSEGHIGNIENHKLRTKLNIRMLARIAKGLELKSYMDFFPDKIYSNDLVKIKIELLESYRKRGGDLNEKINRFKSISIIPLSEEEIAAYDKYKQPKK
ncbi:helix-turn-helix domain-containing protein [Flavobacterium hercynium]|uniref:HTH cro/C1-type domain-containing protein n=1 Tax=Flavobacterium hercynium TaxID=387094 RepID=A0A226HGU2_9FLAO|nr:helix-turn-helix transcriptional regulator [Flavobacterium hercynium]OXA93483.1 hypothetical protein B0A66_06540 [Flavobacterium hercynium]SMP31931.1 Helix-turn-helix [Flavobacterium hercynium]